LTLLLWIAFAVVVGGVIGALGLARRRSGRMGGHCADGAPDVAPLEHQQATKVTGHTTQSALVRKRQCPFCGGQLSHLSGYDRSGADYGGASKEVDDFRCGNCGREFRHIVKDNFTTFYEWWGLKTGTDEWSDLFTGNKR
jgi:transcription elongation factor Elf1